VADRTGGLLHRLVTRPFELPERSGGDNDAAARESNVPVDAAQNQDCRGRRIDDHLPRIAESSKCALRLVGSAVTERHPKTALG